MFMKWNPRQCTTLRDANVVATRASPTRDRASRSSMALALLKRIAAAILLAQSAAPFGLAPRARAPRSVALRSTPVDVTDAAVKQIEAFRLSHAGHEPAELGALEKAVAAKAEPQAVGAAMYELLCTSMLDYDRDSDDEEKLVVSATVGQTLPKDAPGLSEVMTNLYVYGLRMIPSGLISVDDCKRIVEDRIAKRVGLTGEELDQWLDVPDMGL